MTRSLLCALVVGGLALLAAASSHANVQFVAGAPTPVFLAPGAQTTLEFALRNSSLEDAVVDLRAIQLSGSAQDYTLTANSSCPLGSQGGPVGLPVPAGNTVNCSYRVQRDISAAADTNIGFQIDHAGQAAVIKLFPIGDLTRITVVPSWQQFPTPGQVGRLSMTIRNGGPTAIGRVEYGGCVYPQLDLGPRIRIVGGDCTQAFALCFTGGVDQGFAMTDIPAGSSKSCMFEYDRSSTSSAIQLSLQLLSKPITNANLLNIQAGSDQIHINGVPVPTQLPLLGPTGKLILLGVLMAIGSGLLVRGRRQ